MVRITESDVDGEMVKDYAGLEAERERARRQPRLKLKPLIDSVMNERDYIPVDWEHRTLLKLKINP